MPGQAADRKPSQPMADKVCAKTAPREATPMSSAFQTAQEQRPANLAALCQRLHEMAANTKLPTPTTKERPIAVQGPVLVVRGK